MVRRPLHRLINKILDTDFSGRHDRLVSDLRARAEEDIRPADVYVEQEPTVGEWLRDLKPSRRDVVSYVQQLFPFAQWLPRYNPRWLLGDVIAGLTVGFVVVPQAMAYALLAQLSPEYGLYTSFSGAAIYWLFGTSKDIVVGTTAVGSLLVGGVVTKVQAERPGEYTAEEIAKTLSLLSGAVLLLVGLLRLGWVIEFIPYIPISAFVTSAAVTIMSTQIPSVLGITGLNTREAPYRVLINTLKSLGRTKLDAAVGISCVVLLFAVRDFCAAMGRRQPHRKRTWEAVSSLRQVSAMILYTVISFLVNRNHRDDPKFRVVSTIEVGFSHAGPPKPTMDLVNLIFPELPAILIILVIEHIAIAKSFGRASNYTVVPSQEILAQGASNILGPFVGGYSCTGSFGASAVLSKAGVRTPLAGLFSAGILVLALYVLTGIFFYIPMAALAGLIIHAVSNLVTSPAVVYRYWKLSPFEMCIWWVGVLLAIFVSLEVSIYATIGLSALLMLVRLSRARGKFMGRVKVWEVPAEGADHGSGAVDQSSASVEESSNNASTGPKYVFAPLDGRDGLNPKVQVEPPHPGVVVYRFPENFNYTNYAQHMSLLQEHIESHTQRTTEEKLEHPSDRLWCDPGPRLNPSTDPSEKPLPPLRAIVLDFSAVNNLDITSAQGLVHLRDALDKYAAPEAVEWHFASVHNRWTRRTLSLCGFGFPPEEDGEMRRPGYTLGILGSRAGGDVQESEVWAAMGASGTTLGPGDEERGMSGKKVDGVAYGRLGTVYGVDRPFFHVDLARAVDSAVKNARWRDERAEEASA